MTSLEKKNNTENINKMLSNSSIIRNSLKQSLDLLTTDSDDIKKRKQFIQLLSRHVIPMPQKEGEWHAARIYNDEKKDSFYDVEQWEDYLKLTDRHPLFSSQIETRYFEYIKINSKSKKKNERSSCYYC